jgi:hypothetical protein
MLRFIVYSTILLASTVSAQEEVQPFVSAQPCAPMQELAIQARKYQEETLFKGMLVQQHISGQSVWSSMVFTVNQDTGTWSLISLYDNGYACLVANGSQFEPFIER